jgi:hypothetical protein
MSERLRVICQSLAILFGAGAVLWYVIVVAG